MKSPQPGGSSKLLAYLQLFRAPNVFTALADGVMGYVVVAHGATPLGPLLVVLLATALLYTAGMVLNDVYDVEIDRRERPQRPLPSGRIETAWAIRLGYGMLAAGVLAGLLAAILAGLPALAVVRTGIVAGLLALAIVLYDSLAKQTPLGPLVMGSCRAFNILLAMSVALDAGEALLFSDEAFYRWLIAGGVGIYIVGVTWFARAEAGRSQRGPLVGALLVMLLGIVLLASFPAVVPAGFRVRFDPLAAWVLLLVLMAYPVFRRGIGAVLKPSSEQVQATVKHAILSLIPLDAAVVLLVSDWALAAIVFALLVPGLLLGRWVYST